MDLPAADNRDDGIAGLLESQAELHDVLVIGRHVHGALVPEEVGCVEQEHVEDVALDPLTAIEQPSQCPQLAADRSTKRILHGVHGAHLVGHRANAADTCRYVGCVRERTSLHKRLVEAGRLEDAEPHVFDDTVNNLDVHLAFALYPGDVVDVDLSDISHDHSPFATASASW